MGAYPVHGRLCQLGQKRGEWALTRDTTVCSKVVLDLMNGLEDDGYQLYTDNYYTSPHSTLLCTRKASMLVVQQDRTGKNSHMIWCTIRVNTLRGDSVTIDHC